MSYKLNRKDSFIEQTRKKSVVCFGTGKIFYEFLKFADAENISISHVCDNDEKKWGESVEWSGEKIRIVNPGRLMDEGFRDAVIIITCGQIREVYQQLL